LDGIVLKILVVSYPNYVPSIISFFVVLRGSSLVDVVASQYDIILRRGSVEYDCIDAFNLFAPTEFLGAHNLPTNAGC
jgi:hypothetical protein